MILRARILLPVAAPPVEDGAVLVSSGKLAWVGPWRELSPHVSGPIDDLGEVALIPGLVNAHCHLDYTHLAGQLTPPKAFPDWIKAILAAKAGWGFADFAHSWLDGAQQLLQTGTTTVGDIAAIPELLDVVRPATPLRVHSLLELTGVRSQRAPGEIVSEAIEMLAALPPSPGGVGLSPHALYSTVPELLRHVAQTSSERGWPVSMHVAESRAEFDMFMYARGPLYEWIAPQRNRTDCGTGSPVGLCERYGLLNPRFLAVHVNYLWRGDAQRLAENHSSVAHCPQSHAYFHHQRFPRGELTEAGVNVCLGTDSLASTRPTSHRPTRLSMWDEMLTLSRSDSQLSPREIIEMATLRGARALGLEGQVGGLFPGASADLVAIPYLGNLESVEETLIQHAGPVGSTWVGGTRVWQCPDQR